VEFPPEIPATAQVTAVFEFPTTVAVNCSVFPASKSAVAGDTDIVTPEVIMIPTLDVSLVLALETAVTVTWEGLGTVAGGLYKPLLLMVPTVEFPPLWPLTCHVNDMSEYPETSAVNCRVLPSATTVVTSGWRFIVTVTVVVEQVWVELELLLDVLVDVPVDEGAQVLPHPTKENIQTPNSANESARPISDLSPGATGEVALSRRDYCSGRRQ
jgi:hypothetical protein